MTHLNPSPPPPVRSALRPLRHGVRPAPISWSGLGWNLLAWILAAGVLAPFAWVLLASLKPDGHAWDLRDPLGRLGVDQYHKLLGWGWSASAGEGSGPGSFYLPLMNSLLVASTLAMGSIALCAGAGYAFACLQFRGKSALWALVLASLAVPLQVLLVPLFHLMAGAGLNDTLAGAVLPLLVSAFGVFLLRQAAVRMPRELIEAARLDGANEWQIFRHIAFPLLRPAVAALAIVAFLQGWNEFLWTRTVIHESRSEWTVPLYMAGQVGSYQIDYGLILAAAVVSYLPVLALFLAFQREFVSGLTAGAAKE